jgi:hypothetical protein
VEKERKREGRRYGVGEPPSDQNAEDGLTSRTASLTQPGSWNLPLPGLPVVAGQHRSSTTYFVLQVVSY